MISSTPVSGGSPGPKGSNASLGSSVTPPPTGGADSGVPPPSPGRSGAGAVGNASSSLSILSSIPPTRLNANAPAVNEPLPGGLSLLQGGSGAPHNAHNKPIFRPNNGAAGTGFNPLLGTTVGGGGSGSGGSSNSSLLNGGGGSGLNPLAVPMMGNNPLMVNGQPTGASTTAGTGGLMNGLMGGNQQQMGGNQQQPPQPTYYVQQPVYLDQNGQPMFFRPPGELIALKYKSNVIFFTF